MTTIRNKKNGLTLIELLVAIAIVAFLSVLSFSAYRIWQQKVMMINALEEIKSGLGLAQQLAISAAQNSQWGVHLESDRYVIFMGSFYDENQANNKIKHLRGAIIVTPENSFADGAGGFGPNVVFDKFTGYTPNIGAITVSPPFGGQTASFAISAPGIIQ